MKYHNWPGKTPAKHPSKLKSAPATTELDNGARWRFTNTALAMILTAIIALANRSCYVGSFQCAPVPASNQNSQPSNPTSKS